MNNLFFKWRTKIPKYSNQHRDLFLSFSEKYGVEGEKKLNLGKHFSTNYELYIYAFFLGLYNNEFTPIPIDDKKVDFSHHIQHWGSKSTIQIRKDFTNLQEYIFMAVMAKSNIDLLALERGDIEEELAVKTLIHTLESYTNGGLNLIKDKLNDNPNYFLQQTSFLNMILESEMDY